MKKVLMQYPYDKAKVKTYDGKLHEIVIDRLIRIDINGEEYFYIKYDDKSLKVKSMGTFLKKINGVLCKVPLEDYNEAKINQYVADCPAEEIVGKEKEEFFPAVIGLAKTTTIENIANNAPVEGRNITMQYPYIPGNDSIDGTIHDIAPLKIVRLNINGLEYFFMEYFDHTLGHEMFTFLYNVNGKMYKIPLTLYSIEEIREIIGKYGVREVAPSELFGRNTRITLTETLNLRDIINSKAKKGKPYLDYPYFIPYNPENPMSISDRVFRSSCRTIEGVTQEYIFDKEKNGSLVENAIRAEIRKNIKKIEKCESFFISVTVEVPKDTFVEVPTKDGRMVRLEYIPGTHHHRILLTPCLDLSMDKPTRLCDSLGVMTKVDDYHGYEDNDKVFKAGYNCDLSVAFYGIPFTKGMMLHSAITNEPAKKEKVTEVIKEEVPEKIHYVNLAMELIKNPVVFGMRERYLLTIEELYNLYDGVAIDDDYINSYKNNMRISIAERLIRLGYNRDEVNFIIAEFENELNVRREENNVGKGQK